MKKFLIVVVSTQTGNRSREPTHKMNQMTFRQTGVFTFCGSSHLQTLQYSTLSLLPGPAVSRSSRLATDPSPPPVHGSVSVWWSCCQVALLPASGSLELKSTSPSAIVKQQGYELFVNQTRVTFSDKLILKTIFNQYKCQSCKWTFKL